MERGEERGGTMLLKIREESSRPLSMRRRCLGMSVDVFMSTYTANIFDADLKKMKKEEVKEDTQEEDVSNVQFLDTRISRILPEY